MVHFRFSTHHECNSRQAYLGIGRTCTTSGAWPNMSGAAVGNAAVDSTKGTIYQLYLAVLKCFELVEGKSVYIERYGDVTISGDVQIEVKHYAGPLTDSHINFWKTLGNWMRPEFDETKYGSLVLFTTQPMGVNSKLADWNDVDVERRLAILIEIRADSKQRYEDRVAAHGNNKPALSEPESLQIQNRVLDPGNRAKLREVIGRMCISAFGPNMQDLYERVKQQYCKGILVGKRDDMLIGLLGYVICPPVVGQQGWEITFDQFAAKCAQLNSQYCKDTLHFPTKHRLAVNSPAPAVPAKRFVQNIRDIDYEDVVVKAVKDYLYASKTVAEDLANYERPAGNYEVFSDEVLNQFGPKQAIAKRDLGAKPEGAKTFYDEMMLLPVPAFPGFATPNASFRNGVLHMHQDDESKKLNWKLT